MCPLTYIPIITKAEQHNAALQKIHLPPIARRHKRQRAPRSALIQPQTGTYDAVTSANRLQTRACTLATNGTHPARTLFLQTNVKPHEPNNKNTHSALWESKKTKIPPIEECSAWLGAGGGGGGARSTPKNT